MKRAAFGRYRGTGQVIKGGCGEVHVCEDPNLDRLVVVKFLRNGADKKRLLDEIAALQRIRSKNVVQILDLVEDGARGVGIVSEFIPGNDLTDKSEVPADRSAVLRMIYQLANGVADIHSAGLVHRDLKPNNVKYGEERILKVFDFNLAREGVGAQTEGFKGTRGFAAPEQYGSGIVKFSPAVDVYALAATIAFATYGAELPVAFTHEPPDPLGQWWSFENVKTIDPSLAKLLGEALSVNPAARPAADTVRSVVRDLIRRDAHRATITIRGSEKVYHLDATNRAVHLRYSPTAGGQIRIAYDGLGFSVEAVSGAVLVNHATCVAGQRLPDSCVIDLGSPSGNPWDRRFVTFDLSHPEVVQ